MKRFAIVLLAVLLTIGMCSCAKPEDIVKVDDSTVNANDNKTNFGKACAYIERTLDVSKMTSSTQDESDGQSLYATWFADGEQSDAEIEKKFTIDGKEFTLGATLIKETKEMGFTYDSEEKTVDPDTSYGLTMNKDANWINIGVDNMTDSKLELDEMPITVVNFTSKKANVGETVMPFDYKGINEKDSFTIEDVVKAFGAPNNTISLSSDMSGCGIELDYTAPDVSLCINLLYDPATDSAEFMNMRVAMSAE